MAPTAQEPGRRPDEDPNRSFARFLITDLLAEDERAHGLRLQIASWLAGLAVLLAALAFPTERLLGRGPAMLWALADGGPLRPGILACYGLTPLIADGAARLFGISAEAAAYFLSALAYGLCVPALQSLARRSGAGPLLALGLALGVVFCPGAWLAGTLPGTAATGLLAATLAVRLGLAPARSRAPRDWSALLIVCALNPVAVGLAGIPAVATLASRKARTLSRRSVIVVTGVAAAGLGWALSSALLSWMALDVPLPTSMLLGPVFACGFALAAVAGFTVRPRPHESPPPAWTIGLLGFLALYGRESLLWALPALVVGAAFGLERRATPKWRRLVLVLLVAQPLAAFAVRAWVEHRDPDRAWRAWAIQRLEPRDAVLATSAPRTYLLRERWQLFARWIGEGDSIDLRGEFGTPRGGRRILSLDGSVPVAEVSPYLELGLTLLGDEPR